MTTPTETQVRALAEAIQSVLERRLNCMVGSIVLDECARAAIAAMPQQKGDERVGRVEAFYRCDPRDSIYECIAVALQKNQCFASWGQFRDIQTGAVVIADWSDMTEVHKVTKEVWEPVNP
jgi:hypothetical protein